MSRFAVLLVGPVAIALFLAGCAAGGAQAPSQSPSPAAELTPQRGGVLQLIASRPLDHLNPWTTTSNAFTFFSGGVFDQLVEYDYKADEDYRFTGKIVPELAERWEQPDPATYIFRLRKGIKWHDGRPFTAADVKWSYDFISDPANRIVSGGNLKARESISALDEYTIQIKLKEPDVDFLRKLTSQGGASILPKHVHDRGDSFEKVAVGTGPFKVEAFQGGDRGVVYTANKEYWKPGVPYLDKWKILPPADEAGRTAAFFTGQNDVLKVGARAQAEVILAQSRDAKLSTFFQDNDVALTLKLDRPPFNDARVRQAVHLAVDRQAMIGTLTTGDGIMNPPGVNAIYKAWALPAPELETLPGWRSPKDEDLNRAKRLLAEAGHAQGLSFSLKFERGHVSWAPVSEMVAAQLRQIGVDAKLQPMERASLSKDQLEGAYDSYVAGTHSVHEWLAGWHSSGIINTTGLRDPELDRLIESQVREFDETKRARTIQEVQRVLLRQVYVIPTISLAGYRVQQPWVHGWVENAGALPNNPDWSQVWLDVAQAPAKR